MRGLWVLLLLLPLAVAQPQGEVRTGPEVSVLVHHPNDGVDALGFPFRADADAFVVRHGGNELFADTVAFPGFVADGVFFLESLAEDGSLDGTVALYDDAVEARLAEETPISFRVATTGAGRNWTASVAVGTNTPVDGLRLWTALVEDPVHYRPPSGLTNGVFDHPFTVRAVVEHGSVSPQPGVPDVREVQVRLDPEWEPERVLVVAWVEATGGRFDVGEVVQATSHPLTQLVGTVQTERGVLVEAYSATWCEPCLVGDLAVEEVASRHGLQPHREDVERGALYYQPPGAGAFVFVVAMAAGIALALVKLPGGRE